MFIYVQLFVYCVIMESQFVKLIILFLALKHVNAPDLANLDKLRDSVSRKEQRAFIKICVLLNISPRVAASQPATALPQTYLKEKSVYNWYNDFKGGNRKDISDLPRSGRPRETTTQDMKEQVKQLILESDGMRTDDLLYETGIPKTSLLTILSELKA